MNVDSRRGLHRHRERPKATRRPERVARSTLQLSIHTADLHLWDHPRSQSHQVPTSHQPFSALREASERAKTPDERGRRFQNGPAGSENVPSAGLEPATHGLGKRPRPSAWCARTWRTPCCKGRLGKVVRAVWARTAHAVVFHGTNHGTPRCCPSRLGLLLESSPLACHRIDAETIVPGSISRCMSRARSDGLPSTPA